jgi:transposase-like protein
MSVRGKMTRKQETAVAALLSCDTVAEAARDCGVSEATLFRWLQEPTFRERLQAAQRAVLQGAISDLQGVTQDAVATLRRLLTCGTPAVECRAAMAVLDTAIRASELQDLDRRLTEVEAAMLARSGRYA